MKKALFVVAAIFGCVCINAQEAFWATRAAYLPTVTDDVRNANAYGVYPVQLSWDANPDCDYYSVGRFDEDAQVWKIITTVSSEKKHIDENGRVKCLDRNSMAVPNHTYRYKITGVNRIKGTAKESNEVEGYGALTALAYMNTYNESITASHNQLTLMHKKFALSKLGKEKYDGLMAGEVSYWARVRGFSGVVTLDYNDYESVPGWVLRGNTDVKANIWANGKMLKTVSCVGMYPGAVNYDNIKIKKGKAHGGFYTVCRAGFPDQTIVWDAIDTEINGVYKECDVPSLNFKGVNVTEKSNNDSKVASGDDSGDDDI